MLVKSYWTNNGTVNNKIKQFKVLAYNKQNV